MRSPFRKPPPFWLAATGFAMVAGAIVAVELWILLVVL